MARKSRKQTAAPMPAPSLYVHVALYIRLSVEDNKKRGCSVENQKLVLNEHAINALSGEIEVFEKSMDSLDNQLARYRAMEKDAKTLAQDHVLTAELIERLIERIEIDHERNIHVTFRFKNEFQGKAVEPCATM